MNAIRVALLSLLPALSIGPSSAPEIRGFTPAEVSSAQLRELRRQCAWAQLVSKATLRRASLARGTDAWIETSALLAEALYRVWNPHELETVAEAVGEAVMELRAGDGPVRSGLGPLPADPAAHAIDVEVLRARVLASRGEHARAVEVLGPLVAEMRRVERPRSTSIFAHAPLDLGRSLLCLGRIEEGRKVLEVVRTLFPRSSDAAVAGVLLQESGAGTAAYRGKYTGDGAHRARMERLRASLPAARRRLAEALGRAPESLPSIPVGVADQPEQSAHDFHAFTSGDPRVLDYPPVVVFTSEGLSLDLEDPERVLVHELAHAVLTVELGLAYEALPPWASEAISIALAGEEQDILAESLAYRLTFLPGGYFSPRFRDQMRPRFEAPPGVSVPPFMEGGNLAFHGVDKPLEFVRALLAELRRGAPLDAALAEVAGMGMKGFLARTEERLLATFERLRDEERADLEALDRSRAAGNEAVARVAQEVLARSPRRLAHGLALQLRAQALEALGRNEAATAAWDSILPERRTHGRLVIIARTGAARNLARAGRIEEARRRVAGLECDATDGPFRESVALVRAEVEAWAAKKR